MNTQNRKNLLDCPKPGSRLDCVPQDGSKALVCVLVLWCWFSSSWFWRLARRVSAINTIQSVMGINLKTLRPEPCVEGYSTPGGYSSKVPMLRRHTPQ